MPFTVKKRGGKYRVVLDQAGFPLATNKAGTAVDGGGHSSKEDAVAQVAALESSERKRKKERS